MKYFLSTLTLLFLAMLLITCKTPEELATKKAKEFLKCINEKKFEAAKQLSTPESASYIDFLASFEGIAPTQGKEIKNLKCEILQDTAHCTYFQNGEEKALDLIKNKNKWLVDMRKESPASTTEDSTSDNETGYHENDTTTYYTLVLKEMKEVNGSSQFIFEFHNRSDWNISHLWMELFFTDKNGKFLQKKEVYLDGLLKESMMSNLTNAEEIKRKNHIELMLDKTKVDEIGEIFLLPVRIRMESDYYEGESQYPYLDNIFSFSNYYVLIKNSTEYNVKITFE